ncbi:MAG TPA: PGPGW domain-containing protein [Candidatus Nanoarchaeia archaeon]|nr:PGPGW domain-containing protein [Candidatus Nanoarchaeia archaeon]
MNTIKKVKRVFVVIVSLTVLSIGFLLLVLPGPGILIIILGLVILAAEFVWAKRLLKKIRKKAEFVQKKIIKKTKK